MEHDIEDAGAKRRWILTHDSHKLKKGEIFEGTALPPYLAGKAVPAAKPVQRSPEELQLMEELREEIVTLSEQLNDAKSLLKQKSAEIKELVAEIESLQKESDALRLDNAELQAQLKGKKG